MGEAASADDMVPEERVVAAAPIPETAMSRRDLLTLIAASSAAGLATSAPDTAAAAVVRPAAGVPRKLDRFIGDYMHAMNAPGLTLAIAKRQGPATTAAYGFVDLASKKPVTTADRFEIGSISKSFTALLILKLQDAGKLDVQQPILRYLPWLPIETDFGEILVHHLLTHTSGMPDDPPVISSEPGVRVRQAYAPGTRFHYSNWGFEVLGLLIESVDGRPWPMVLASEIFAPLGMTDTAPTISSAGRSRIAQSYVPLHDDRPYPRRGPLVPAGNLTFAKASGSIASTPLDMARYMQMLLNRGEGPAGRLVSEQAFTLFSTPHTNAPPFGPKASYGYGIAIDDLDGHKRLRHTGGMVSFMSAIHLDMDAGVGAFASINAQQGYRPNPVAQYAVQLARGDIDREPPPPDEGAIVKEAGSYAGVYRATDGRVLEIRAEGERLVLQADGARIPLQHLVEDQFVAEHPRFVLFPLLFGRAPAPGPTVPDSPAPEIIELSHGPDWYAGSRYSGATASLEKPELAPYVGFYYSGDAWVEPVRIVQRRGQLWANGVIPLERIGEHVFRFADEPASPEIVDFRALVGGQAQWLYFDGSWLRRISVGDDA
jgi:CubicO group peptidase (beta-lactamase class C family)